MESKPTSVTINLKSLVETIEITYPPCCSSCEKFKKKNYEVPLQEYLTECLLRVVQSANKSAE